MDMTYEIRGSHAEGEEYLPTQSIIGYIGYRATEARHGVCTCLRPVDGFLNAFYDRGERCELARTTIVGVFEHKHEAQQAVRELRNAGFRDDQIGVVVTTRPCLGGTLPP